MIDHAVARHNMVSGQIRTNRVTDERLIEAMEEIPRELFVPRAKRGVAYVDEDVEIASGRYLMEPMVLARLVQEAEITASDVVLDVGCGTGYASAVMARLAGTVIAPAPRLILSVSSSTMRQAASPFVSFAMANPTVPDAVRTGNWTSSVACELKTVAMPVGLSAPPIHANTTWATTGLTQSRVA